LIRNRVPSWAASHAIAGVVMPPGRQGDLRGILIADIVDSGR